jgi:phenylpropionate dioxygenase-like ring-hydroxylating dioxygenase large terminal subunit
MTKVISWLCAPANVPDEEIREELDEYLTIVGEDDRRVCESVQRAAAAGLEPGPLLRQSEAGVIDFHRRLSLALRSAAGRRGVDSAGLRHPRSAHRDEEVVNVDHNR